MRVKGITLRIWPLTAFTTLAKSFTTRAMNCCLRKKQTHLWKVLSVG